jgi:hypothetical protein
MAGIDRDEFRDWMGAVRGDIRRVEDKLDNQADRIAESERRVDAVRRELGELANGQRDHRAEAKRDRRDWRHVFAGLVGAVGMQALHWVASYFTGRPPHP